MYIPSIFEVTEKEELYEFMEDHSFAALFSQSNDLPTVTHLPLLIDRKKGCLYGHMTKANPQWKDIKNEVLIVFNGPHTYISPSWYETNQAVPTWNYTAVHVTGKFSIIAEQHDLLHILEQTTHVFESSMLKPWEMKNVDLKLLSLLTDAIVGFKIEISKIEGVRKLSQNHSKERRQRVIHELEGSLDDDVKKIAELMKREMLNE
jgi:transcriptional regulator